MYTLAFFSSDLDVVVFTLFLQPTMHGDIDPAVLAALPPSVQLDLLVQVSVC